MKAARPIAASLDSKMVLAVQYVERRDVCILERRSLDPYTLDQRQASDKKQTIKNESSHHNMAEFTANAHFKITGIYTVPSVIRVDRIQQISKQALAQSNSCGLLFLNPKQSHRPRFEPSQVSGRRSVVRYAVRVTRTAAAAVRSSSLFPTSPFYRISLSRLFIEFRCPADS